MTVETSLGISNVSVQPEVNRGIVPEPGQIVPEPPFVLSLRRLVAGKAGSVKPVPVLAKSVLGRMEAIIGSGLPEVKNPRGLDRIRGGRGGRRPRCSRCYGKHFSGVECRAGISGLTPPVFTSQLLTLSLKTP